MIELLLKKLNESERRIRRLINKLNEEKEGRRLAEGDAKNFKKELNNIVRKGKFYAFLRNFDIVATLLLNPAILIFLLILITII